LRHPARFRLETVGFVFQLHYLLPELTAQQNVELPLLAARMSRKERARRSSEVLREVGLGDRPKAQPSDLSGGERQRVAIARALAARPKLILADEPTGALDSRASEHIWALLANVAAEHGTTMIVASHDPSLAERMNRTLQLLDGRLTQGEGGQRLPDAGPALMRAQAP
jgi:ABC-type lipoprotein export system ATPase subunit